MYERKRHSIQLCKGNQIEFQLRTFSLTLGSKNPFSTVSTQYLRVWCMYELIIRTNSKIISFKIIKHFQNCIYLVIFSQIILHMQSCVFIWIC